jgi:hypothetical protein
MPKPIRSMKRLGGKADRLQVLYYALDKKSRVIYQKIYGIY